MGIGQGGDIGSLTVKPRPALKDIVPKELELMGKKLALKTVTDHLPASATLVYSDGNLTAELEYYPKDIMPAGNTMGQIQIKDEGANQKFKYEARGTKGTTISLKSFDVGNLHFRTYPTGIRDFGISLDMPRTAIDVVCEDLHRESLTINLALKDGLLYADEIGRLFTPIFDKVNESRRKGGGIAQG